VNPNLEKITYLRMQYAVPHKNWEDCDVEEKTRPVLHYANLVIGVIFDETLKLVEMDADQEGETIVFSNFQYFPESKQQEKKKLFVFHKNGEIDYPHGSVELRSCMIELNSRVSGSCFLGPSRKLLSLAQNPFHTHQHSVEYRRLTCDLARKLSLPPQRFYRVNETNVRTVNNFRTEEVNIEGNGFRECLAICSDFGCVGFIHAGEIFVQQESSLVIGFEEVYPDYFTIEDDMSSFPNNHLKLLRTQYRTWQVVSSQCTVSYQGVEKFSPGVPLFKFSTREEKIMFPKLILRPAKVMHESQHNNFVVSTMGYLWTFKNHPSAFPEILKYFILSNFQFFHPHPRINYLPMNFRFYPTKRRTEMSFDQGSIYLFERRFFTKILRHKVFEVGIAEKIFEYLYICGYQEKSRDELRALLGKELTYLPYHFIKN
jgi:hypothetical protein